MAKLFPKEVKVAMAVESLEADGAFDVTKLLAQGGAVLAREMRNIMSESSKGKLSPTTARDLVAYVKLLSELEAKQAAELANMTDEQLAAQQSSSSS